MAAVERYTDPYIAAYRRVPPSGAGVCAVCHSGPGPGYAVCYGCHLTASQVSQAVATVLPISLYRVHDQYWYILRNYKDHRRPAVRTELGMVVAATIARFTTRHWSCISAQAGGEPTLVATVPSTRPTGRPGPHPLTIAIHRIARLAPLHRDVLARGPGVVGHQRASDDAFVATGDLRGERVLLVEDTFTSGARTQSAACALRRAGAASVAVVVAGRVIDPDWNDNCASIWRYATRSEFRFDECAHCAR
jgi:predicted amidophosphoribosyltransferase